MTGSTGLTLPCHEQRVLSGKIVDGLVVLLSTSYFDTHIAIAHGKGIWMTRATGASETGDIMIVATDSELRQAILVVVRPVIQCDFSE